jgi:ribose transport system ATP-binding protein
MMLAVRTVMSARQRRNTELMTISELAEVTELRARGPEQEVRFLSGGNQQKVVLSKWLETKPQILIFDEPTRGIDVGAKAGIHDLIRKLAKDGVAVLMISSELPELIGMSDRILVMHEGHLAGELPAGASEPDIMELATGSVEVAA